MGVSEALLIVKEGFEVIVALLFAQSIVRHNRNKAYEVFRSLRLASL
tara:strand:- start:184 stop:324 length:141 start_codon:yes stop_codon:yes gene_type:complete